MNYRVTPTYYNRLRHVKKWIKPGRMLLNAGCGSGDYSHYLRDSFDFQVGIDISHAEVMTASRLNAQDNKLRFTTGSLYDLPFRGDFFDAIICIDVLEHVDDPKRALDELWRVAASGCELVFSVPVDCFPFLYDPINWILCRKGLKPLAIGAFGFGHSKLFSVNSFDQLVRTRFHVAESKLISHALIGFIENYIPSLLARLIKTNRDNKGTDVLDSSGVAIEKRVGFDYQIPALIEGFDKLITSLDEGIFSKSSAGINLLVRAVKAG